MHAEAQLWSPPGADVDSALRAQLDRVIAEVRAFSGDDAREGASDAAPQLASELPPQLEKLLVRLHYLYPNSLGAARREAVELGELTIDFGGHEVRAAGRPIHLTRREFGVLRLLVRERDRALSRDEILERVWGDCTGVNSQRTVDIHMHRLRTKLGDSCSARLQTLRNVGYKLRYEPVAQRSEQRRSA
jgi:DNA-binding response OmpR family regulator